MIKEIEIVNEEDRVVGKASVEEVHRKGLLHRALHIFIVDDQGKLFCRQRSLRKERYPGFWSTSVGSHVLLGETYDEVASSSLEGTLGIRTDLDMIGKARVQDEYENEISATYVGRSVEAMQFNQEQIEGGKFMTVDEIKALTKEKNVTPHLAHSLDIYLESKR